jgi:secondary thiamine-phosphate synthase enzyme
VAFGFFHLTYPAPWNTIPTCLGLSGRILPTDPPYRQSRPRELRLTIEVQTLSATEIVDVTERVEALVGGASDGSCHLYLRHTTAALMIVTGENGVPEDIMDILQTLTPKLAHRHASSAHVAAHFLSALVGPSVCVPVRDGTLALGEFQRIVLTEFEGPRKREIEMRLLTAI